MFSFRKPKLKSPYSLKMGSKTFVIRACEHAIA